MREKNSEAGALNTGPEKLGGNSASYSKKRTNTQGAYAPLHLLVDHRLCRCDLSWDEKLRVKKRCLCAPRVVVLQRGGSTFVGVVNRPWGFSTPNREFLGGGKSSQAYAEKLREELRALAWAAAERRDRNKALRRREIERVAL